MWAAARWHHAHVHRYSQDLYFPQQPLSLWLCAAYPRNLLVPAAHLDYLRCRFIRENTAVRWNIHFGKRRFGKLQKNSWRHNTVGISPQTLPSAFAGSVHLQCCADDPADHGELRVPKMGPGGRLVHGPVLYGADTWLHGIHVSNPERLPKTGKCLSRPPWHLCNQRLLGISFLSSICPSDNLLWAKKKAP